MLGGLGVPGDGLPVIPGDAHAVCEHAANIDLRGSIALFRGLAKPGQRLLMVSSAVIPPAERELGGHIACLGLLLEGDERAIVEVLRLLSGEGERT